MFRDAMHAGRLGCDPSATLPEIARIFAKEQIHCVVVRGIERTQRGERLTWGVVTADRPSQISAARIDKYLDVKLRERDEIIAASRRGTPLYETVPSANGTRRLRRRPLSNGSINKQVDVLARVLKDAQKHGWIGANPAAEPERRLIMQRPERSFPEPEQVAALLEGAAALQRAQRGLTWKQVEKIRSSDRPARALAREVGVSDVLVGRVRSGEIWRDGPYRNRNDVPRHAPLAVVVLAGVRIDELCG